MQDIPQNRCEAAGRIGAAKVLLVETGSVSRGSPVWQLNLAVMATQPDRAEAMT
jgi:hypothetical protein